MAALAAGMSRTLERLPDGLEARGRRGRPRPLRGRTATDSTGAHPGRLPRVLVLDEATANLDYATESEVKRTLASLTPPPTMIIIAHRYSMLKDADQVVVLDHGRVAERIRVSSLDAADGSRNWRRAPLTPTRMAKPPRTQASAAAV